MLLAKRGLFIVLFIIIFNNFISEKKNHTQTKKTGNPGTHLTINQ